jgi:uncharacterized protein DUF4232
MRTGARLAWQFATAVAFGATAALAVTLSGGAPLDAALASAKASPAQHAPAQPTGAAPTIAASAGAPQPAAAAARPAAVPGCAASGLRVSVGPAARVTSALTRYPLDFTNVSGAPCTLAGYPQVAAYAGDGGQVGAAAGRETSAAARRILLAPGQTAHASLDAAAPQARCRPVRAEGLRVVPPGQRTARDVRRPFTACSARDPLGRGYLRVAAVQPGPGPSSPA